MPQPTKTTEQLPVKLTGEELLLKSKQLAQMAIEKAALEDQKKTAVAAIKAQIDEKTEKISQLVEEVHRGEELRPIECFERPRYGAMMVDIVREDFGVVVRQRPMHPSERQMAISSGDLAPDPAERPKRAKKEAPENAH